MKKLKALKRHTSYSAKQRYNLLVQCNFRCMYCHSPITLATSNVDHLIPFEIARETKLSNAIPCCYECNQIKSNKIFTDFTHAQEYIQSERIRLGLPVLPDPDCQNPNLEEILQSSM